jgi:DUF3054 family protein
VTKAAAWDAVALLVFVLVGVLTHDASVGAFFRDAACILGGWFAVASATRLYVRGGWRRLVVTWLVGVSAGVLVRAAVVGHLAFDFWGVALAFTAVFVLAGRVGGQALLRNRASLRKDIAAGDDRQASSRRWHDRTVMSNQGSSTSSSTASGQPIASSETTKID